MQQIVSQQDIDLQGASLEDIEKLLSEISKGKRLADLFGKRPKVSKDTDEECQND